MKFTVLLLTFLSVLSVASAAPFISDVSGELVEGSTLSIEGSDFGVKSPVEPIKYDSFDQGSEQLGQAIDTSATGRLNWTMFSSCAGPGISTPLNATRYSDSRPRYSGDIAAYKYFGYNDYYECYQGTNYLQLNNPNSWHEFYLSMWLLTETNGDENLAKVRNVKIANWANRDGDNPGYPQGRWDLYPMNNGNSGHVYVISSDYNSPFNSWGVGANALKLGQEEWNRFEAIFSAGDIGVANGGYAIYRDGQTLKDSGPVTIMTDSSASPVDAIYITHYYDDIDEAYDLPMPQAQYWHGEIYIDDTPARIELCNVPDWSLRANAHCELQIPKDLWNGTHITADVHLGSFTQEDIDTGLYLYIIDADGVVSEAFNFETPILLYKEDFETEDYENSFRSGTFSNLARVTNNSFEGSYALRGNFHETGPVDPITNLPGKSNPVLEFDGNGTIAASAQENGEVFVRYHYRFDQSYWKGSYRDQGSLGVSGKSSYVTDQEYSTGAYYYSHNRQNTFGMTPNGAPLDNSGLWGGTRACLTNPETTNDGQPDGQWHEIAVYFNHDEQFMAFWVDGVQGLARNEGSTWCPEATEYIIDGKVNMPPEFLFRGLQIFYTTWDMFDLGHNTVNGEYLGGWQLDNLEVYSEIPVDYPVAWGESGSGTSECGDLTCESDENYLSCPVDCRPTIQDFDAWDYTGLIDLMNIGKYFQN